MQHSEIAGTADTIARYTSWLPACAQGLAAKLNYKTKIRTILPEARLHSTVLERFKMPEAPQCVGVAPYRPEALREHIDCKQYYPANNKPDEFPPTDNA